MYLVHQLRPYPPRSNHTVVPQALHVMHGFEFLSITISWNSTQSRRGHLNLSRGFGFSSRFIVLPTASVSSKNRKSKAFHWEQSRFRLLVYFLNPSQIDNGL